MGLETTVIGSYPKPDYLKIPDWFKVGHYETEQADYSYMLYKDLMEKHGKDVHEQIKMATKDCMAKQTDVGIDVITDGEMGVGDHVTKTIHLCCGYPNKLDEETYEKADKSAYAQLSIKLDSAGFDAISIEDAHRHNDLSLFKNFTKTKIILGVVAVARSRVESYEEIRERIADVLRHIPRDRLVTAPDCGLGFLPEDILLQKLRNMVKAAASFV